MKLPLSSARLAAWTSAFLAGLVSPDDVAEHAPVVGQVHRVAGLGGSGVGSDLTSDATSLPVAVAGLRRAGAVGARLVWLVPGDATGLAGPSEVNKIVLAAGQGVLVELTAPLGAAPAPRGLVLVPSRLGSTDVLWSALPADGPTPARDSLAEADRVLKETVREATDALESLDVARLREEDEGRVAHARRRPPPLELPRGYDNRARVVLDTTQRLTALLEIASDDDGSAVSRTQADARRAALRDLEHAVRRAFVAAINSLADEHARAR